MAQPSTRRGHRSCKLGPLVQGSGESQRSVDNGATANENREREAQAGVASEANVENATGAGDLGADETVGSVDDDVAANADVDVGEGEDEGERGGEGEGQDGEIEGMIENNDNTVQAVEEASSSARKHAKKGAKVDQSNEKSSKKQKGRTHTRTILEFINHTGCLTKFLDAEYDNPARPDEERCTTCKNCLDREQAANPEADAQPAGRHPSVAPNDAQAPAPRPTIAWLRPAARKEAEDELRRWRRAKWESPECARQEKLQDEFRTKIQIY
ncbi:hypothetical protein FRC12_024236 [Ceratobasidium sp. 428]|nr:hypothetical protein FRC12_024236 [Ceratobasidium sp. 428]